MHISGTVSSFRDVTRCATHVTETNIFFCAPAQNPAFLQDTVAAGSTKTSVTSPYC